MKIKFVQQHIVRGQTRAEDVTYENGQVADFGKDPVDNSYARAYVERGYAEEFDEVADRAREKARGEAAKVVAKLDARGKIVIPDDLTKLADADLIKLGQSLSDDQVKTKDDALKAIETEKSRRVPT
jgi:hypothetical protein